MRRRQFDKIRNKTKRLTQSSVGGNDRKDRQHHIQSAEKRTDERNMAARLESALRGGDGDSLRSTSPLRPREALRSLARLLFGMLCTIGVDYNDRRQTKTGRDVQRRREKLGAANGAPNKSVANRLCTAK